MYEARNKAGNGQKKIGTLVEAFTAPVNDRQRQDAVRHLVDYLESGTALVARCEELAQSQPNDMFGAMSAAARLMQANARVAEALSRIVPAEQRRRSVVLHITDDRPTREELIREIEAENAQAGEDVVKKLEDRLRRILEREQAAKVLFQTPPPVKRAPRDGQAEQAEKAEAQTDNG